MCILSQNEAFTDLYLYIFHVMGCKSLKAEYIFNMHTFGTKCSADVEIPPVLLSAFTEA